MVSKTTDKCGARLDAIISRGGSGILFDMANYFMNTQYSPLIINQFNGKDSVKKIIELYIRFTQTYIEL